MSCHGDVEKKCREHVFSLQPTPGEADEFKKLNVGLLAADASWPPLLTNYLHRYMHSYNLYQVVKSKTEKLSNLVVFLGSRAELSAEEDVVKRLTQKCISLITTSAQQWKQDGLLVSGGTFLRKSKTLRQVWNSHSDSFGRVEIRHHWGSAEMPDPTSIGLPPSSGSRKRATDSNFPRDVKKVCRDQEPTLNSPDGVHSIDDREMAEPSHASKCSQTDDAYDTIVVKQAPDHSANVPLAYNSYLQPSENRDGISDNERLVHTAQETLGAVQQAQTLPPITDLTTRTSRLNAPHPIQKALDKPRASLPNMAEHHRLREGPPMVSQTPKDENSIPSSRRSESSPPDPTSIPFPPNLPSRFLERAVKKPASPLHTQPGVSEKVLHSPHPRPPQKKGLAASLEHAVDTPPETALGDGQFRLPKEGQLALRKLKLLGQLLVPRRGGSGLWLIDVDDLMLQDTNKFCDCISRVTGLPKILELSFELLDLKMNIPYIIRTGDFLAFHSLKLAILNEFLLLLNANPKLASFRILVTVPQRSPHQKRGVPAPLQLDVTTQSQPPVTGTPTGSLDSGPSPRSRPPADQGEKSLRSHLNERGSNCGNAGSQTQIVVRIQQTSGGAFSPRYQRAILGPGITNGRFFAWVAKKIGHQDPLGPLELEFCFKDALPPKRNVITRGNEEHFDYMKRDINYMCKQTAEQVPELSEFTILVMPRRWTSVT